MKVSHKQYRSGGGEYNYDFDVDGGMLVLVIKGNMVMIPVHEMAGTHSVVHWEKLSPDEIDKARKHTMEIARVLNNHCKKI
jgi:hypothetical protein